MTSPVPHTNGLSPKAAAAGAVGLLVGIAIAVLNAVQDANLLGDLAMPLQVILLAAIPPVLTFLGAYQASPGNVVSGSTARHEAPPVNEGGF
jgi:hypothetical protein